MATSHHDFHELPLETAFLDPFGRRHWGAVEKGDRHRAGKILGGFGIDSSSEPVPLFHSTDFAVLLQSKRPPDTKLGGSEDRRQRLSWMLLAIH